MPSRSRADPARSRVRDHAGAWARCARRFPHTAAAPLSNADLALGTALRPTVSRLTYTLAQLGYLKRNDKGRLNSGWVLTAPIRVVGPEGPAAGATPDA